MPETTEYKELRMKTLPDMMRTALLKWYHEGTDHPQRSSESDRYLRQFIEHNLSEEKVIKEVPKPFDGIKWGTLNNESS